MRIRRTLRRGLHGAALLSMLSVFSSGAFASDALSYQTAAASAVARLDFARALEIYTKGLEQPFDDKERAHLLLMRGIAADLANKSELALSDFNAVVKMVGDTDPRAYRERGFFYQHEGRYDLALADYTTGAKLFPRDAIFPNGQGRALMEQGKFDEAIARFDEAIRLDPASGPYVMNRAEAFARSDRPQIAIEGYDRALALGHLTGSDTYRLRVGAGSAHLALKNETAAIESLDKAVELNPKSPTALRHRGLAYERAGKLDRARRDYEAIIALKPGDKPATERLQKLSAR